MKKEDCIERGRPAHTGVAIWALLLGMPYWMAAIGGYTELATRVVVMGLAAMSLNFLLGFTGVLSFGHAAYFGLGAYGTAMAIKYVAPNTWLGIAAGVAIATLAAALIGALIVKRRGVYFAMVTIAFGQILFYIAYRWDSFTGGYDGLRGFSRQPLGFGPWTIDIKDNGTLFYYFVLAVFAVCVALMAFLLRSPFGRTLIAIRENQRRAQFLGIAVDKHIWLSFSISCFFASTAGALYALLDNFADPTALNYTVSGEIVIMVVMGGMRNFWGPLIGAAIYVVLQDYISSMTQNWMSFIGLLFVMVVMFFPSGILGMLKRRATT